MRNAFAQALTRLAQRDPRVVLLSGDIGNKLFDDLKAAAPGRVFNCGVAEANMTGMAAGLAKQGFRPVTYTITPFATVRCLEQIRVDLCYHRLPVIVAGTGSGLSYTELGPTHHSCEDIALLRALPNLTVLCPCDATEVGLALEAALAQDGPVYLRLGKKGEPAVHGAPPAFRIGKAITVRPGTDLCILATGTAVKLGLEVAEALADLSVRVESVHTVKPLDQDLLEELKAAYPLVVTLEEHSLIGGLGGAVAEWAADHGPVPFRLLRFGTQDRFLETVGSQDYGREQLGIGRDAVTEATRAAARALGLRA